MSSTKSTHRQKNRRYGKASKNSDTIEQLESLDRFAGSSADDMDENEEQDDDSDDGIASFDGVQEKGNDMSKEKLSKVRDANRITVSKGDGADGNSDGGDGDDEVDSDSDDEKDVGPKFQITTGIANAMNRILSAPSKSGLKAATTGAAGSSVVLSKTKTPLQIQAEKEKKVLESLKEKRRVKRERQIQALHIPLTVATNTFVLNSSSNQNSLTKELEMERMHRRVATRGIVALFNAIAHHQVRPDQTAAAAAAVTTSSTTTDESRTTAAKPSAAKLTKNGFLDLIKHKAITSTSTKGSKPSSSLPLDNTSSNSMISKDNKSLKQWNALKEDYMLDSTKNWDEVDDDQSFDADHHAGSEKCLTMPPKKKIRHKSRN
jgi:Rrp15p